MADELLKSNPSLAAKHSVRSLASIVDKANTKEDTSASQIPPLRIVRLMNEMTLRGVGECSLDVCAPQVTVHENPRVQDKLIDPSNLPYLHRNPAI
ncbi:MAG: hypothetical protein SGPRY_003878 [Prymnesium sp.]